MNRKNLYELLERMRLAYDRAGIHSQNERQLGITLTIADLPLTFDCGSVPDHVAINIGKHDLPCHTTIQGMIGPNAGSVCAITVQLGAGVSLVNIPMPLWKWRMENDFFTNGIVWWQREQSSPTLRTDLNNVLIGSVRRTDRSLQLQIGDTVWNMV